MKLKTIEPVMCHKVVTGKNDNGSYTKIEFAWMGGKKDFFDKEGIAVEQGKMYHLELEMNGKYTNLLSAVEAKAK